jgi:hypothetical protein
MPAQRREGKLRRSIRQREQAKKRRIRKLKPDDTLPALINTARSFTVVSGGAPNILPGKTGTLGRPGGMDSTFPTTDNESSGTELFTVTAGNVVKDPKDASFAQGQSPRSLRYQVRSLSRFAALAQDDAQMDFRMVTGCIAEDSSTVTEGTPAQVEIQRLQSEIKSQNKTIRSLQRKLATEEKAKIRRQATKLRQTRFQDTQRKKLKALQISQVETERKTRELENVNRKLAFDKAVDDEVRLALEKQFADYKVVSVATKQRWFQSKLEEIKKDMGCEVVVTRVNGSERTEDLTGIHVSMRAQLKPFKKGSAQVNLTKVEYVLNERLHAQFKDTKAKLKAAGRNAGEVILFHGTDDKNIEPYLLSGLHSLTCSILSDGFLIGGIDGFLPAHGSSMVSPFVHDTNRLGKWNLRRQGSTEYNVLSIYLCQYCKSTEWNPSYHWI